jgi:hypothetical protein
MALGLSGATESAHMGHPDFRAHGRIFATLHPGEREAMIKLTPEDQARFLQDFRETFEPEPGAWGRQGCTRVNLAKAAPEVVGEALTLAWQLLEHPPARSRAANSAPLRKRAKKLKR